MNDGWLTRQRVLTSFLAIVTLLLFYLCFRIVLPFLPALAFSIAIAVCTQRPYSALTRISKNKKLTAGVAVILVGVLIVAPASIVITSALNEGVTMFRDIGSNEKSPMATSIESSPIVGDVYRWAQRDLQLDEQLRAGIGSIVNYATAFLTGSVAVLTQLLVTLFVLFFLYRDGDVALTTFRRLLPLTENEASRLLSRMNDSMLATVNGSFAVSMVQACLAGAIYLALGVPGAVFWAVLTFFMALIPMLGTAMVWIPIALYLAVNGHPTKALILVGIGISVIGTIDNLLYPYLVGNRIRMHPVPTFVAVIGGVFVFGAAGLILGPLVVSATTAILDVWWQRTKGGESAETAIEEKDRNKSSAPGAFLKTRPV